MLTRQKVILEMLRSAGRPVQRVELMKWCFLLRHESASAGGNAFYDFVPYKFGPFSFALYQEIEKLQALNYVVEYRDQAWKLNPDVAPAAVGLIPSLERDVEMIVAEFRRFTSDRLLNYVYGRYPSYTVNSERQKLAPRPKAEVAVYTAGYESVSVDGFLDLLISSGIERLIDVRSNPIARRYGFHRSTLSRLLGRLDIEYRHFAELGIRSEIRQRFPADGDRSKMF